MSIQSVLAGGRSWWVEQADVRAGLAMIPDGVVGTVVTSPPYFGMIIGGFRENDHGPV